MPTSKTIKCPCGGEANVTLHSLMAEPSLAMTPVEALNTNEGGDGFTVTLLDVAPLVPSISKRDLILMHIMEQRNVVLTTKGARLLAFKLLDAVRGFDVEQVGGGNRDLDGKDGIRDTDNPCSEFITGPSRGDTCEGDGHYLCLECVCLSDDARKLQEDQR